MASQGHNTINWDAITLDGFAPSGGSAKSPEAPQAASVDHSAINWDAIDIGDLKPDNAVDYGNGAYGAPGGGSEYGGDAVINTASKRDRGEREGTYADLNGGWGGTYDPAIYGGSFGLSAPVLLTAGSAMDAAYNAATGKGPQSFGEAYAQNSAQFERDKALYERDHPIANLAGTLTGGLLTGGAEIKAINALLGEAKTLGGTAGRGALAGGIGTGIYAANDTKGDLADKLTAGVKGAALGATVGGVLPVAGAAITGTGRAAKAGVKALNDWRTFNPANAAEDAFVNASVADRVAHNRAAAEAANGVAGTSGAVPPARSFMDAEDLSAAEGLGQRTRVGDLGGDRARRTVRDTLRDSPDAAMDASDVLGRARQQHPEGIANAVEDLFGGRTGVDPQEVLDALHEAGRKARGAAYDEAYNHPVSQRLHTPGIRSVTGSRAVQDAMAKASEDLAEEMARATGRREAPQFQRGADGLMDHVAGPAPSLRYWDHVQRNLSDAAEHAKGPLGKMTNESTRLAGFRNQLVDQLDNATTLSDGTSLFRKARGTAKQFFDAQDAHEAGLKYFQNQSAMNAAKARAAIDDFNPAERELFARGYAAAYLQRLSKLTDGADVAKLLNNADARRRLQDALGADRADIVQAMTARAGIQGAMADAVKRAASTARSGAQGPLDGVIGGAVRDAALGHLFFGQGIAGAAAGVVRKLFGNLNANRQAQVAEAMSKLVTSHDPAEVARIYQRIADDPQLSGVVHQVAGYGITNGLARLGGFGVRGVAITGGHNAAVGDRQAFDPSQADARLPAPAYADGGLVTGQPNADIARESTTYGEHNPRQKSPLDMTDEDLELIARRAERKGTTLEEEAMNLLRLRLPPTGGDYRGLPSERREARERSGAAGVPMFASGGSVDAGADRMLRMVDEGSPAMAALMKRVAALEGADLIGPGDQIASPGGPGPIMRLAPRGKAPTPGEAFYASGGAVAQPSKWEQTRQALWESNLNAPVRGFYNLMNTPTEVLLGAGTPVQQDRAVADSFDAAGGMMVGGSIVPKPDDALMMGIIKPKGLATGKPERVRIPGVGELEAAPINAIDDAAEAYMRRHGIEGTHRIDAYPASDEDFARRVAGEYGDAKHAPGDPAVRKSYDQMIDETIAQYDALKGTGLDIKFLRPGEPDPYAASPALGYHDIQRNGRLQVFPTDQGYGSSTLFDPSENPLLKSVGKVGDKHDAVANDAFRVVHDAYGHFGPGNPFFRHQGEDRAWQHHARMFSDEALPAMTAETRGQNSWLNFGPHGEKNRQASGAQTVFADQKAVVMPKWVIEKDLGRLIKKYGVAGASAALGYDVLDGLDEAQAAELQKLDAEGEPTRAYARGGSVRALDAPNGNATGGEPKGVSGRSGGEGRVATPTGTGGPVTFSAPGGGMGKLKTSSAKGGRSSAPKAQPAGGGEPRARGNAGGGEARSTHRGKGGEPTVSGQTLGSSTATGGITGSKPTAMGRTAKLSPASTRRNNVVSGTSRSRMRPERLRAEQAPPMSPAALFQRELLGALAGRLGLPTSDEAIALMIANMRPEQAAAMGLDPAMGAPDVQQRLEEPDVVLQRPVRDGLNNGPKF